MKRPNYLSSYKFNWEIFEIVAGGKSSLDAKNYLGQFHTKEDVESFLSGYGFNASDPIQNAELFGNFQEAVQFIRRYFLKEGNPDGVDYKIPERILRTVDVSELFLFITGHKNFSATKEEAMWASIILKVMHTILHADKDLRYRYFTEIQKQIFDRYYKYLHRDEDDNLFLKSGDTEIPLVSFETKSKKSRESIIIKLLHKQENVAEELFDRVGVRFVTKNVHDTLRVIKFLYQNYIVMVNNIKPSRSQNSLIDIEKFRREYYPLFKSAIRVNESEEIFAQKIEDLAKECLQDKSDYKDNDHTSGQYKAIHFTCRQLIKYKNPFMTQFNKVRKMAKETEGELSELILNLDTSPIARDVRFFYPYEVQITDEESHQQNTQGEASHQEYKKSQLKSAMKRLFSPLAEIYGDNSFLNDNE
jgi:uncharacterized protein (TIGR04562 family)